MGSLVVSLYQLVKPSCIQLFFLIRGVPPCNSAGPNAHNQIGIRATASCVKLCRVENLLATHARLERLF